RDAGVPAEHPGAVRIAARRDARDRSADQQRATRVAVAGVLLPGAGSPAHGASERSGRQTQRGEPPRAPCAPDRAHLLDSEVAELVPAVADDRAERAGARLPVRE